MHARNYHTHALLSWKDLVNGNNGTGDINVMRERARTSTRAADVSVWDEWCGRRVVIPAAAASNGWGVFRRGWEQTSNLIRDLGCIDRWTFRFLHETLPISLYLLFIGSDRVIFFKRWPKEVQSMPSWNHIRLALCFIWGRCRWSSRGWYIWMMYVHTTGWEGVGTLKKGIFQSSLGLTVGSAFICQSLGHL